MKPHQGWRRARSAAVGAVLTAAAPQPSVAQSPDWQFVSATNRTALANALVIGGEDRVPLYACRAQAGAGVHTGRFRTDFTGCHIGYNGEELNVVPFEVLAPAWQEDGDGGIPQSSLPGGERVQTRPEGLFGLATLYPCRSAYQSSVQVGEVARGDRGCSFGFGGRQVTEAKYQVLWQAPWMTWVPGIAHQLPADAVVAGVEGGEPFFICRAADQTGLHPGKVKQSAPGCSIASDGKEVVRPIFSLLVPRWMEGNAGSVPVAALPAGNERGDLLFLCRTRLRGTLQVGKLSEQLASCHVGMLGAEVASQAYEVFSAK